MGRRYTWKSVGDSRVRASHGWPAPATHRVRLSRRQRAIRWRNAARAVLSIITAPITALWRIV